MPTGLPLEQTEVRAPLVIDVTGNSLDDGPGIRSVVFLKGCPLACVWCHNPESKKIEAELSFDPAVCVECGACADACPESAISMEAPGRVLRDKCTSCFECIEVCPSGALSRVGETMTVEQVVAEVLRDKPFYDASGGGVTVSGGEPTLFTEFLGELLRALKAEGIHTLVETDGLFNFDAFVEHALPFVDTIYFDLKIHDDANHRKYCGTPNGRIFDNFARLHALQGNGEHTFELLPRTPLIPGLTASDENLSALAGFLQQLGAPKAQLLPYNPLWHDKMRRLGRESLLSSDETMNQWMSPAQLQQCKDIFTASGIEIV